MGIIHQRNEHPKYAKRKRHPAVLQSKKDFIELHKETLYKFFVTEHFNWESMPRERQTKYFSPEAIAFGKIIKGHFGYEGTAISDILFHFKRLFIKMYPEYEFRPA